MKRLECFPVRSRFMNMPDGTPPEPAQHFAHYDRAANAKDGDRPRFPQQNMDELVQLRIRHATESSSFAA